jgi:tetrahydromethanopterin S-methyltransferase subunit F
MKIKLKEAKSLDDMMKDANRIKKELADAQREYNKSKTETNKAKVEAKKGQLERVANAIRNARANQRESVVKSTSLNEVTVTRIPNFNLESDAYIIMLYLLKNNSGFKKAATNAGIDLFSGANVKSVFAGLHNNLKKVITPQIVKAVVETINQDRKKIFIDDADIQKGVHTARFAGLLALGVVDSFINDPIDYKLINDLGNAKLKGLADEFSIGRGKIKLGAMLGNKGF